MASAAAAGSSDEFSVRADALEDPAHLAEKSPESDAQFVKGNGEQPSSAPVEAKSPPADSYNRGGATH